MDASDVARAPRLIETPRLVLRVPRPEDGLAFLTSLNRSLPTLRYIEWGLREHDLTKAELAARYDFDLVARGEGINYYAFLRDSGDYVARIDLHSLDFEAPRAEIGYVGDVLMTGRGLVREAVLAVVQAAFDLGFARVHALSDARNERALHFARACGFEYEGSLRHYERDPHGQLADMAMFATYNPRDPQAASPADPAAAAAVPTSSPKP